MNRVGTSLKFQGHTKKQTDSLSQIILLHNSYTVYNLNAYNYHLWYDVLSKAPSKKLPEKKQHTLILW